MRYTYKLKKLSTLDNLVIPPFDFWNFDIDNFKLSLIKASLIFKEILHS